MRISDWSSDVCSSDLLFGLSWLAIRDRPATTGNDTPAPETIGQTLRGIGRSEEHTSELQSLMRISYAVFCLKKKKNFTITKTTHNKIPSISTLKQKYTRYIRHRTNNK